MSGKRRVKNVSYDDDDIFDYFDDFDEDVESAAPHKGGRSKLTTKAKPPVQAVTSMRTGRRRKASVSRSSTVIRASERSGSGEDGGVNSLAADAGNRVISDRTCPQDDGSNSTVSSYQTNSCGGRQVCIVVIGHVDAGKSTLVGQLLWQTGSVETSAIRRLFQKSSEVGREASAFAWLLDEGEDERQRGVTIDVSFKNVFTADCDILVLDTPGHRDFVPNMIGGAVLATVAVLVVDVPRFRKGFAGGGQTREHVLLTRAVGIRNLVVVMNRLDELNWDEAAFLDVRNTLNSFLCGTAGFQPQEVVYVPVSSLYGVNVVPFGDLKMRSGNLVPINKNANRRTTGYESQSLNQHYERLSLWWRGPSFLEVIKNLPECAFSTAFELFSGEHRITARENSLFAAVVCDCWRSGDCVKIAFRVASGSLRLNEVVILLPQQIRLICRALECSGAALAACGAGAFVTSASFDGDVDAAIEGNVLCKPSGMLPVASILDVKILVLDHEMPIIAGRKLVAHVHTSTTSCAVVSVYPPVDCEWQMNKETACAVKRSNTRAQQTLAVGSTGCIRIRTERKICTVPAGGLNGDDEQSTRPSEVLSRIILRDGGRTVAAGIITSCSP